MNLALWLERAGKAFPSNPAVALGEAVVHDYATLAARASKLAGGLADLGLKPGDRVAICSKNRPAYVEAMYGIWWGGFAAVPANAKLHGAELGYILEHSGARVCLVGPELAAAVDAHAPEVLEHLIVFGGDDYDKLFVRPSVLAEAAPDDLAWLFYTSGTTGRPKGAMLTHRNLYAMALAYHSDIDPVDPGDAIVHAAPMSHGSGIYMVPHVLAAACNVVPESGGFEPEEIFRLADVWPGTSLFAAPTMVKRMTECPADPPRQGFRAISYGGGPMYVEDARAALQRFGPCLVQIYGQGESPMTITVCNRQTVADKNHPRWAERLASVGIANSAVAVRVADADDRTLPPGETGEILVAGDAVMKGYWNNPEASAETLKGGWLHTGDLGAMDENGFLTLKDRAKDVIISGGSNIYPREVEEVLLEHPDLREVSVIGRPHPEWGEIIVAYVVGDAPEAELDELCLNRIARFKRPKAYVRLEALPKNNYGKVLKTELRQLDK
ncbi:MAG: AMP-binding protein [Rhodospirillaceae bacterium]|nr:AMP-binding protein [Rhodospirillaceae bacterium]